MAGASERRVRPRGGCGGLFHGLVLPELVAALDEVLRLLERPRVTQVPDVARQLAEEKDGLGLFYYGRLQGDEVVPHDGGPCVAAHRIIQPSTCHLGGAEAVRAQEEFLQLLVRVLKADGSLDSGRAVAISENGSFANDQWNFVSGCMILAAANIASMQSNHDWGKSA